MSIQNENLQIPQYVNRIQGHVNASNKAFKVKKALYGLRQDGPEWNIEIDRFLEAQEFKHGHTEPCLYVRWKNGVVCLILVYVDDLLAATKAVEQKNSLFKLLDEQYGIKDHGRASQYVGVEIDHNDASFSLRQIQYIREVL